MNLEQIQAALQERGIGGWLFCDAHHRDPLAYRILGLAASEMVSRRWFYFIPAKGQPRKLVHRIESDRLDSLPGTMAQYAGWRELIQRLQEMLAGSTTVAMQYSPQARIPAVSLVDAGTVELIRSLGPEVVSSADLVQYFEARWSSDALDSHVQAGKLIDGIVAEAFDEVATRVRHDGQTDECAIQQFVVQRFAEAGLVSDAPPIVAVNANTGNPHYSPQPGSACPIQAGDFILLDVWGKLTRPGAVYYDITWTAYLGDRVPERIGEVFAVVRQARDAAVQRVQQAVGERRTLHGWEVDRAARDVIERSGFGPYFVHRTGHSLGEEVHGFGANMDDLETHDERQIIAGTAFSIEPGIYLPEFGVRSELNVFVGPEGAQVTGAVQNEIVTLGVPAASKV